MFEKEQQEFLGASEQRFHLPAPLSGGRSKVIGFGFISKGPHSPSPQATRRLVAPAVGFAPWYSVCVLQTVERRGAEAYPGFLGEAGQGALSIVRQQGPLCRPEKQEMRSGQGSLAPESGGKAQGSQEGSPRDPSPSPDCGP